MTQKEENKNSSYKMLYNLFESNASITDELPAFTNYVSIFKKNCVTIDTLVAKQGIDRTGLSNNKEMQREALISATLDVSKRMLAYATVEEIATLKTEAKVTDSELRKLADTKLKAKAQSVYDIALANATVILPYGVTEQVTTDLLALVNAYDAALIQPKMGITDQKQATTSLNAIIRENDGLLKKTDALMELVKASHPDFYNSYKTLRKVVAFGKGKLAMQILVKDALTGGGIQKVAVVIEEADVEGKLRKAGADMVKIVKRTSEKGGIKLKSLPEGTYTITVSKPGYATEVVTVNVINGELCNVVTELVKN